MVEGAGSNHKGCLKCSYDLGKKKKIRNEEETRKRENTQVLGLTTSLRITSGTKAIIVY